MFRGPNLCLLPLTGVTQQTARQLCAPRHRTVERYLGQVGRTTVYLGKEMNMRKLSSLLTAAVAAFLPMVTSAQTPKDRAPLPNEQWVQLFNGKDLSGWNEVGKEKWTVRVASFTVAP